MLSNSFLAASSSAAFYAVKLQSVQSIAELEHTKYIKYNDISSEAGGYKATTKRITGHLPELKQSSANKNDNLANKSVHSALADILPNSFAISSLDFALAFADNITITSEQDGVETIYYPTAPYDHKKSITEFQSIIDNSSNKNTMEYNNKKLFNMAIERYNRYNNLADYTLEFPVALNIIS